MFKKLGPQYDFFFFLFFFLSNLCPVLTRAKVLSSSSKSWVDVKSLHSSNVIGNLFTIVELLVFLLVFIWVHY